jgi:hypothetical protein
VYSAICRPSKIRLSKIGQLKRPDPEHSKGNNGL